MVKICNVSNLRLDDFSGMSPDVPEFKDHVLTSDIKL